MNNVTKLNYLIASDPTDDIISAEFYDQSDRAVFDVGLSCNTGKFKYWLGSDSIMVVEEALVVDALDRAKRRLLDHDAQTPRDEYWDYKTFAGKGVQLEVHRNCGRERIQTQDGRVVLEISGEAGARSWTFYPHRPGILVDGEDFDRLFAAPPLSK